MSHTKPWKVEILSANILQHHNIKNIRRIAVSYVSWETLRTSNCDSFYVLQENRTLFDGENSVRYQRPKESIPNIPDKFAAALPRILPSCLRRRATIETDGYFGQTSWVIGGWYRRRYHVWKCGDGKTTIFVQVSWYQCPYEYVILPALHRKII